MFDPSVSLGSLLTIGLFIVTVTVYIVGGKTATRVIDARLMVIDMEIKEFKKQMEKLTQILVQQAEQNGRMDQIEDRQLAEGKRIDSMSTTMRDMLMGRNPNGGDR